MDATAHYQQYHLLLSGLLPIYESLPLGGLSFLLLLVQHTVFLDLRALTYIRAAFLFVHLRYHSFSYTCSDTRSSEIHIYCILLCISAKSCPVTLDRSASSGCFHGCNV
ncbi:hypothetical protein SODALDRAFT_123980 [Sodiomyces alkalinus F11]|uniref:Uncharacterized protein n=1 Tax=Sodiomyces alkalinus (strain CBS 110278 / VKM F-3762 / F11) TaxID=1314773 RepID=A0A3N2Q4B2_SODAK|nr:hypothetical protein SODALDRAFT_123980 [Sodiomyces alkalinus F11]ROT41613.1 hypothetical protein SODALDRAFT_123980 [Sodiomyces alkalinus F11]